MVSGNINDQVHDITSRLKQLEELLRGSQYDMKKVATTTMNDRMHYVAQSEQMFGMYTALCVETQDVWKQNRIRFFCPLFHDPNKPIKGLPWAWPISAMGGFDDCGLSWVPPAGSTLCLVFEGGARNAPYYMGTTWSRFRGKAGEEVWKINVEEYQKIWQGHRKGYLCGADDESQVLPPWNTESMNGYDLNSISDFDGDPEAQKRLTFPHIYGFKTPEKHMLKLHDGDPKCNRRWKRIELLSSCGNWLIFKDDHLHYAGQWAHKDCGGVVKPGSTNCIEGAGDGKDTTKTEGLGEFISDISSSKEDASQGADNSDANAAEREQNAEEKDDTPEEGSTKEKVSCGSDILGGKPNTPYQEARSHGEQPYFKLKKTKHQDQQTGDNPYFKHKNECRPYKGPENNRKTRAELPQTGIQIMSISGHTIILDDSVEEPTGDCAWERVMKPFDYGCNDIYSGRIVVRSHAGHSVTMSDLEETNANQRSDNNFIRIESAAGNVIELNDHEKEIGIAGERRGIAMQTTSKHLFLMIDEDNEQTLKPREEGNEPVANAKKAFIKLKSGYGLEFLMRDDSSQKECDRQFIQIFCPQKAAECGPHILRFQERPSGGQILLRAGGDYITSTCREHIEVVGDKDKNPSNKITIVSKNKVVVAEKTYLNVSRDKHVFIADKQILLLAGKDAPIPGSSELGPYPAPVVVYQNGKLKISDRVIASCSKKAACASIFMLSPIVKCEDDDN